MTSATGMPPRLLVKTLAVIFVTVALLLGAVFVVVTVSVRDQVRQSVAASLESGQRILRRRRKPPPARAAGAGRHTRREPDAEGGARHLRRRSRHEQRRRTAAFSG